MKMRYFLICGLLVAGSVAAGLIAYPHLPERVPSHWNMHGQVNGYLVRWDVPVLMPGIMAGIMLLFAALPWLSPKHFEVESFESTYLYIMVIMVGILAYTQALMIWAALLNPVSRGRMIMGGAGLFIALLGNVMGKIRRNFYIGIRTPWTLADERVWNATHRFGAKTFTVGGLIALILALSTNVAWLPIGVILIAGLSPALYSLVVYKRFEHNHEV